MGCGAAQNEHASKLGVGRWSLVSSEEVCRQGKTVGQGNDHDTRHTSYPS